MAAADNNGCGDGQRLAVSLALPHAVATLPCIR
jgi:hypothetical protein